MKKRVTVNLLRWIHIYKDIIGGSIFFITFLAVMICSLNIKQSSMNVIGSAFMPKLISGIMLVVSGLLILQGLASVPEKKATLPAFTQEYLEQIRTRTAGVIKTLVLFALTIILLKIAGFVIAGVLYLFCQITLLTLKEERNYRIIAIQSVVITLITYLLFRYGFSIILPMGIFA